MATRILSTTGLSSLSASSRKGPWLALVSLAALVLLWQLIAWLAADPRLLPHPLEVFQVMVDETESGTLPVQLGITLLRVAVSFTLAFLIGTSLGILLGRNALADGLGAPWVLFFLNLPALVVIVLAYVWIGLVESAAILAVALNKIPNVTITVREGVKALDPGLTEMAQAFRIGRIRTIRHVILPQLAPYLIGATRTGLALIWKIVLVVELLGRPSGVGFEIGVRFQLFDVAGIMAYAIAFVIVVQAIEWGLVQPIERRLGAWRR